MGELLSDLDSIPWHAWLIATVITSAMAGTAFGLISAVIQWLTYDPKADELDDLIFDTRLSVIEERVRKEQSRTPEEDR
jgi:hypothetical protein